MRGKAIRIGLAAATTLLFPSIVAAAAPSKEQCVNAYQGAQLDMKQSALASAREKLTLCLAESCPSALHADCADWLKEVERRQPSVVLSFKGKDGAAATSIPATLDGKPFLGKTDGRAVNVDPGEHTFVFSPAGEPSVEVRVVVREGEKSQRVEATSKLFVAPPKDTPGTLRPLPPATQTVRPVPWSVIALGGIGLVGIGGFAGFGIAGTRGKADLELCKPACAEDDVASVRTRFVVADVSFAIGLVALGAATVLFLTRPEIEIPKSSEARSNERLRTIGRTSGPSVRWLGSGVRVEL